jgi:hypothetical protein
MPNMSFFRKILQLVQLSLTFFLLSFIFEKRKIESQLIFSFFRKGKFLLLFFFWKERESATPINEK